MISWRFKGKAGNHPSMTIAQSPEARGKRLREARKLARLTLKSMSTNSEINFHTLSGWEIGRHNGLTEKGAKKVVERLTQAGVNCSVEWLMQGTGNQPASLIESYSQSLSSLAELQSVYATLIQQHHPNMLQLKISDNSMQPLYAQGDFVAGQPITLDKLSQHNGKAVIVKLNDKETICRILSANKETQLISLLAKNTNYETPVLHDVHPEQIALVIFHIHLDDEYLTQSYNQQEK